MSAISKKLRNSSHLATFLPTPCALLLACIGCSGAPATSSNEPVGNSLAGSSYAGQSSSSGAAGRSSLGGSTALGGGAGEASASAGVSATGSGGNDNAAGAAATGGSAGSRGSAGAGGAITACDLAHAPGVAQLSLMSGGVARKVRLFVPSKYDGHTRLPLVLNLHGSTDNADNFATSSQMEQVAESEGFAVAGLEAVAGQWNVPPESNLPDDVKYGSDAVDLVAAALCIDDARVYASGFSGGGRMSSQLGCQLPDKVAAIGPVAGVRFPGPCPGRAVPVITIHGLVDTTNAYAGEGPTHPRWNESVEDAVRGWASKNGCSLSRLSDDPPGPLSTFSYAQCSEDASVKLIRMDAVAHAYPTGTPLHTAKEVWAFLKQHSRH